jgi:hypothetical protein
MVINAVRKGLFLAWLRKHEMREVPLATNRLINLLTIDLLLVGGSSVTHRSAMPKHERALILALLLAWQVGSAATLWAAASQSLVTVPSHRAIVTGIYGEVLIHAGQGGSRLNFHAVVKDGEWLTTGPRSGVELLVGKQAFVTLGEHATFQFLDSPPDHTAIRVQQGEVRLAVAAGWRGGDTPTPHESAPSPGVAWLT